MFNLLLSSIYDIFLPSPPYIHKATQRIEASTDKIGLYSIIDKSSSKPEFEENYFV